MNWELAFSVKGQSANTLDSEGLMVSGQLLSSAMIICKGMGQVDSVFKAGSGQCYRLQTSGS